MRMLAAIAVLVMALPAAGAQEPDGAVSVGEASIYLVRTGDTVSAIAGRFGMSTAALAAANRLTRPYLITPGQRLTIDRKHLAALDPEATITINVAQRMLFISREGLVTGYAITVGTRDWPTPLGPFTIVDKERDPVWDVPVSIQREMKAQGKPVITQMEPSPANPLGAYWLRLSIPGLGIHGTNAPSSIYRYASHGCIRMHPDDIAAVFDAIAIGTRGTLIYEPIMIAVAGGSVLLEAHPDPYGRQPNAMEKVKALADRYSIGHRIDWQKVVGVLRARAGRPEDVTAGNDPR